ncbi:MULTISPECIES: energy transducer TonB [unclassified Marinimicrobium]|jgi:protein TonB|uniref:energy transducer TonB n=1 Tax=unclassified Marinimicrobium TaxID=2632100 RepID=UPI00257B518C|nr:MULTISPECIES: energy transducer TonB [unclassified Marinimicrobium]
MIQQPRPVHWLLALSLAFAVHTLAMVRLDSDRETVHRAEDPGAQSITIALAPPPKPAQPTPAPEPEPQPQPEPEPLESPVKTPEPEEEPEPQPEPEPEPEPEPKPEPEPEPEVQPEPEQIVETDESTESADEHSDQEAKRTADRQQAGATGGIQDAPPDYRTQVSAWLERHKEYPMRARRKAEQGMAMVSFTFDRDGNILDYELMRPTGHNSLDEAVEEMLEKANPLPKMPDDIAQSRMTWTLPVYFRLN